jgi:hypothetical protein
LPRGLVLLPQAVDLLDHRLRGARSSSARGLVHALEVRGVEVVALGAVTEAIWITWL